MGNGVSLDCGESGWSAEMTTHLHLVPKLRMNGDMLPLPYVPSYVRRDCSTVFYVVPYILTYLLTYLLTPWSRVLLEKLTGSAAIQEIPRIFGTRRFITVLTSARHLSLS